MLPSEGLHKLSKGPGSSWQSEQQHRSLLQIWSKGISRQAVSWPSTRRLLLYCLAVQEPEEGRSFVESQHQLQVPLTANTVGRYNNSFGWQQQAHQQDLVKNMTDPKLGDGILPLCHHLCLPSTSHNRRQ
jgi:hypothetical protein